ncbi:MAG: energy transducer TonB [Gemmatimonadaceae bacterium]|nr:energy transducer TonB [Gemmatimonadaceae bacterium]MCW5826264.1 energy transducer TonB [Gemmatimonadaceae bacterium]
MRINPTRLSSTPSFDPVGTAVSVLAHAAVVVATAVGSVARGTEPSEMPPLPQGLTFLVPPPTSPAPAQAQLRFDPASGDGGTAVATDESAFGARRAGSPTETEASASGEDLEATSMDSEAEIAAMNALLANAYQVLEVDSAAVRDPSSAAPVYPKELEERGIEGYVIVRFVVDSTGRVDLATILTIESTAGAFDRAVREALPRMRFRPALVGDRPVRQLAEQMFKFEIPRVIQPPVATLPR